jgi:formate dehydrogenase subunit gamma
MSTASQPWNEDRARAIAAEHAATPGGLLNALHAIQAEFGFVPKPAMLVLAHAFNISRAEVYGVASFYHDFRLDGPPGRHVLKLCRAEACQAVGCDAVAETARKALGLDWHETSADGRWTLEPVFCLGLCANGPSAMIDGRLVARVDDEKVVALIGGAGA